MGEVAETVALLARRGGDKSTGLEVPAEEVDALDTVITGQLEQVADSTEGHILDRVQDVRTGTGPAEGLKPALKAKKGPGEATRKLRAIAQKDGEESMGEQVAQQCGVTDSGRVVRYWRQFEDQPPGPTRRTEINLVEFAKVCGVDPQTLENGIAAIALEN